MKNRFFLWKKTLNFFNRRINFFVLRVNLASSCRFSMVLIFSLKLWNHDVLKPWLCFGAWYIRTTKCVVLLSSIKLFGNLFIWTIKFWFSWSVVNTCLWNITQIFQSGLKVPVYGTRNYQSNHFLNWNENIQENLFFEIESNENLNGQSAHFRN